MARATHKVLVFSPYLTSETAELVLRAVPAALCEIYTTFCAETFASGGSSIRTLRLLVDESFAIYELDGLHAKIILISGHSVSIGSQNLTRGGTINKEATVFLTAPAEVARVEKALAPWIAAKTPITAEMIADMESRLPRLRKIFRKFRTEALATNAAVKLSERTRRQQRVKELQMHLARLPTAKETIVARVKRIDQTPTSFHGSWNYTVSLVAKPGDDLTRWIVQGDRERLDRMFRYMCILENTGRIGWARVGITRVTFVNNGIEKLTMEIGGWQCDTTLDAIWPDSGEISDNVRITLSPSAASGKVTIAGWFGIERFSVSKILVSDRSATLRSIRQWISANTDLFQSNVTEQLTRPFQYDRNRAGVEAGEFFGPVGSIVRLKVSLVGGHPVLRALRDV